MHPCRNCRDRDLPSCRGSCSRLQAWNDLKEIERKAKERERILDGYTCDACREAKRGGRRHDGRTIR